MTDLLLPGSNGDTVSKAASDIAPPEFVFLKKRFGDKAFRWAIFRDDTVVAVDPGIIVESLLALRDEFVPSYNYLSYITADHWIETSTPSPLVPPCFTLVYELRALPEPGNRIRLIVVIPDTPDASVPSVTGVYPGANWHEREVFDLFGINFDSHPNLTRILTPETYTDHPMRRDFPIQGPELLEFHDRMVAEWNVREEREYLGKFGDPWMVKILEQQKGRISLKRVGDLISDNGKLESPGDIAEKG